VLRGPPAVGKTGLAVGLGLLTTRCCERSPKILIGNWSLGR
jgi:hypothetical protein